MNYITPDYEKVALCATDAFAGYSTGCPEDEFLTWQYTVPCAGTDDYRQVANTMTGMGYGHQCYSTLNP